MPYQLKIHAPEGVSVVERGEAESRFCAALANSLGGDALVAPVYAIYQRLVVIYGETPDVEAMVDAEREVFESWQAAETAAMIAAFGTHRYLDEGGFELTITE